MDLVAPTGDANLTGDVRTIDRMGANGFEAGNYTNRFGATSAACPQVSGVAALMLSANPNLTEVQVRGILQQTATHMGSRGFNNDFGFGRVNAYRAVLSSIVGSINGVDLVCAGPYNQYTYQNLPTGISLSWSSNTPNGLSIGTNSGLATGIGNFSGPVNVLAILTRAGCPTNVPKPIWVGIPGADNSTLIYPTGGRAVDPITLLPNTVYQFNSDFVPGASSFTWMLPSGFSFVSGQGTSNPGIRTSATYDNYTLYCTANNVCGSSWTHSLGIIIDGSCIICPRIAQDDKPPADETFAKIALYPNPANIELKVRLRAPSEQEGELSMMDFSGNVKRNGIIQKGTQWITLGTSDLFPGMYVIKINDGSKVYYRKVLVQH